MSCSLNSNSSSPPAISYLLALSLLGADNEQQIVDWIGKQAQTAHSLVSIKSLIIPNWFLCKLTFQGGSGPTGTVFFVKRGVKCYGAHADLRSLRLKIGPEMVLLGGICVSTLCRGR